MTVTMGPDLPAISYEFYESTICRIDPEIKAEWVDTLRTGEYRQGRFMLQTPDGAFCCLGVYCDMKDIPFKMEQKEVQIAREEWQVMEVAVYGTGFFDQTFGNIPRSHAIPFIDDTTRLYARGFSGSQTIFHAEIQGPPNPDEPIDNEREAFTLPILNDGGFTFNQIADVIDYFL